MKMATIGIVDYGMGNILSVKNAFEYCGAGVEVCSSPENLKVVEKLVLPGVGAFGDCIKNIKERGFKDALDEEVIKKKTPILGICLGMQVMAKKGYENGENEGLGWFDAEVVRIEPADKKLRIPHVGWNDLDFREDCFLFRGMPEHIDAYFVHSYYMKCVNKSDIAASFDYSGSFTAAVMKGNIIATQFHPEKSQDYGRKMLENFIAWNPKSA
ncbi:MAG: imidazole glycerol phosphate synthase subunit HisH [Endomicrobiales bacterium]|nr:imidazole glycerol phosphate synthase subunit HisH [Endomicrobiales bacterium]